MVGHVLIIDIPTNTHRRTDTDCYACKFIGEHGHNSIITTILCYNIITRPWLVDCSDENL